MQKAFRFGIAPLMWHSLRFYFPLAFFPSSRFKNFIVFIKRSNFSIKSDWAAAGTAAAVAATAKKPPIFSATMKRHAYCHAMRNIWLWYEYFIDFAEPCMRTETFVRHIRHNWIKTLTLDRNLRPPLFEQTWTSCRRAYFDSKMIHMDPSLTVASIFDTPQSFPHRSVASLS